MLKSQPLRRIGNTYARVVNGRVEVFLFLLLLCCIGIGGKTVVFAAAAAVNDDSKGGGGASTSSSSSSSSSLLERFVKARCGPTGAAVWLYEGTLVDPVLGQPLAHVQGVELVRTLAVLPPSPTFTQRHRFHKRLGDLAVADAFATALDNKESDSIHHHNNNNNVDEAATILSRKLFCYTPLSTTATSSHANANSISIPTSAVSGFSSSSVSSLSKSSSNSHSLPLLRKVRLRPTSPERTIPIHQAAVVYDTATTFCPLRSNSNHHPPPIWAMHTEYADGRCIHATTTPSSLHYDPIQHTLDYSVFAKPLPLWRQKLDWKRILLNNNNNHMNYKKKGTSNRNSSSKSVPVLSPPRASLIQVGGIGGGGGAAAASASGKGVTPSSPNSRLATALGARETYHYRMPFGHCLLRYTRYGEGPAWYGPGRMCTLELTGKRLEAWSRVPSPLAQLVYERAIGFLSVHAPVPTQDDALARRAVQTFRGAGASTLQIAPYDHDDDEDDEDDGDETNDSSLSNKNRRKRRRRRRRRQFQQQQQQSWSAAMHTLGSALDRIRSATSFSIGGSGNK